MIIRRYRNGVLVNEEVHVNKPQEPKPETQKAVPVLPTAPNPTAPKKGCGCGAKRKK